MSGTSGDLMAAMPSSPIVWIETGELRLEWFAFFRRLWARTGGAQGGAAGTGTITGVSPGVGLSGGGTSGGVVIALIVPVSVVNGGTGATTAAQALMNLGAISNVTDNVMVWG